jgi:hypothetical protein
MDSLDRRLVSGVRDSQTEPFDAGEDFICVGGYENPRKLGAVTPVKQWVARF